VIAIEPLISEPRGRGPRSGGGCLFQRRPSRARDEERERDRRESSRLLVSQANVSTVLFLDASYWSRKAETGLCQQTGSKSPPAEGSLASPDASPGIATWRSQPCVRRCSFGALRLIPLFPTRSQPAHPNPGLLVFLVSSPGGFHPQALSEPDLNLSIHPAPIIQPNRISPLSSVQIGEAPCEQELLAIYPLL